MIPFLLLLGWSLATQAREQFPFSKPWLNILHYQKHLTGYKSEVDGPRFFFAEEGKRHPEKEFKATLKAFEQNPEKTCNFPARKKLLEKEGYKFAEVKCPEYETWRQGLPVSYLSVIFATAYPNNPASMFGHTFLRLNGPGEKRDLLDYAVNFAATTGSDGGLEFAVLGVFGRYEGHYSLAPYFIKVNEYNHGEARDLWEYPLNLSPEAIDMLLAHLWEIEANTYFEYYFFDENCSWQILRLIEAADPSIDLTSKSSFYIIPKDTVQTLAKANLLGEPVFRPSLRRQYRSMVKANEVSERLDKKLLYHRLRERMGKSKPEDRIDYHQSLVRRSKDPAPPYLPSVPLGINRPDLGHGLRRISVSVGDGFKRVSYKFAHHDLLDNDLGHERWSALDVLRITPEESSGKVFLRELTLLDATSLHAWDGLDFEPSWYLNFGAEAAKEFSCIRCFTPVLKAGLGQTININDLLFGSLFLGGRGYGYVPEKQGETVGFVARALLGLGRDQWKLLLDLQRIWGLNFDQDYIGEFSFSWSFNSSWAARAHISKLFNSRNESGVSFLYYF